MLILSVNALVGCAGLSPQPSTVEAPIASAPTQPPSSQDRLQKLNESRAFFRKYYADHDVHSAYAELSKWQIGSAPTPLIMNAGWAIEIAYVAAAKNDFSMFTGAINSGHSHVMINALNAIGRQNRQGLHVWMVCYFSSRKVVARCRDYEASLRASNPDDSRTLLFER